jgi:hypothetical protein
VLALSVTHDPGLVEDLHAITEDVGIVRPEHDRVPGRPEETRGLICARTVNQPNESIVGR